MGHAASSEEWGRGEGGPVGGVVAVLEAVSSGPQDL